MLTVQKAVTVDPTGFKVNDEGYVRIKVRAGVCLHGGGDIGGESIFEGRRKEITGVDRGGNALPAVPDGWIGQCRLCVHVDAISEGTLFPFGSEGRSW